MSAGASSARKTRSRRDKKSFNRRKCPEHAQACFYCDKPLEMRHEHDHFPIPWWLGGEETVPCCVDCHDWKDRKPYLDWPLEMKLRVNPFGWVALWPKWREARIYYAKMLALAAESLVHEARYLEKRPRRNRVTLSMPRGMELGGLGTDE